MWDFVKLLPLAVLLPVGLFMASVGPNDARENISKWAPWLRRQIASMWIVETLTYWGVVAGIVGMAVTYAFLVWGFPRLKASTPTGNLIALTGMLVCGVGLTSFTSIYVILTRSDPVIRTGASPASLVSPTAGSAPAYQAETASHLDLQYYARHQCFDYSTHDGSTTLRDGSNSFQLKFSKGSRSQIYLYKDSTNLQAVARVRNTGRGEPIDFVELESSSRVYSVGVGEQFVVQNSNGFFLQGKILSIKDDTRGDTTDEVCFAYEFDRSGIGQFLAL